MSSGQTAIYYAISNLTEPGRNLVTVPQLYGTTHSMFAHFLPKAGIKVRFAESDQPSDIEKLIDCRHAGDFLRECR